MEAGGREPTQPVIQNAQRQKKIKDPFPNECGDPAFDPIVFEDGPSDEEYDDEEEQDDEDEEIRRPVRTKKKPAAKVFRQRWDETEIKELNIYFKTYLEAKVCPNTYAVRKAKKQSKERNGQIWKRLDDKIIKKNIKLKS